MGFLLAYRQPGLKQQAAQESISGQGQTEIASGLVMSEVAIVAAATRRFFARLARTAAHELNDGRWSS